MDAAELVRLDGHLCKFVGNPAVDAALLGAAVPYQLLALDDPRMVATIEWIERDLRRKGGGAHRYRADTYYGGGADYRPHRNGA
ncbi:MAG TPA: hypothetical protein VFD70_21975 [Anaerolineae bacterium]|nr:hypothetical protein [Anaerolineae bacterium]